MSEEKKNELKEEELENVDGGGYYPWCNSYNAYQARNYHVCPTYDSCPTKGLCKATSQGEVKE